jgi:hypothetical protein
MVLLKHGIISSSLVFADSCHNHCLEGIPATTSAPACASSPHEAPGPNLNVWPGYQARRGVGCCGEARGRRSTREHRSTREAKHEGASEHEGGEARGRIGTRPRASGIGRQAGQRGVGHACVHAGIACLCMHALALCVCARVCACVCVECAFCTLFSTSKRLASRAAWNSRCVLKKAPPCFGLGV